VNLKPFVNDKHLYDDFQEELRGRIRNAQSGLETVTSLPEICQFQGEIKALRKLLLLREKVNGQ
jgi:hypothetical protein